jgi:coenzyme F420-reducing hydrogenase delta subunit/ferredoxin
LPDAITEERVAVKLNEEYCSRCSICRSLCPYDAITKDTETGKIILDIAKCQVCGICYSACPSRAIDTIYYDHGSLINYLEKAKQKYGSQALVIMCKGSAPDFAEVGRLFGVSNFIPLSVPCVGRIPDEVFLTAVGMGIRGIYVLACDEDYCRFERGSPLAGRRILALNRLLEQLGYGKETITLKRNSLKVKVDKDLCISCGNCVYYCPYHAPRLESVEGISFDLALCRGCGLCVVMCPSFALELENWERERISALIPRLLAEMKPPKLLVFRCQWAFFSPLDGKLSPNIRVIDLPCAARVDAIHILGAFQKGADGVLIAACSEEDCKQEKAGGKAQRLVTKLNERLSQIGYQDRLHFCSIAPRHGDEFDKELRQFSQKIKDISEGGSK